jgi:hypothetical protein
MMRLMLLIFIRGPSHPICGHPIPAQDLLLSPAADSARFPPVVFAAGDNFFFSLLTTPTLYYKLTILNILIN